MLSEKLEARLNCCKYRPDYQMILDVDDYPLESQLSLAKLALSKCDPFKMDLLRATEILSNPPIAHSGVLKLIKLVAILPVTTASNERFF